ncbi:MAG: dTMP kinase [Negativicutes bacterium]
MAGIFITMEGPDGSGKTTQIALLAKVLTRAGLEVVQTREPGGTPLADRIRELVLDPAHDKMAARTEALLYMAARAQHTAELIRPAMERGAVVISDRYTDSSLVYQGVARGLPIDSLIWLNRFATEELTPDLTLLLDGDTDCLVQRVASRGNKDRLDNEDAEFHRKVREGFLLLAAQNPDRFCVIDADRTVKSIQMDIQRCVLEFLQKRGR